MTAKPCSARDAGLTLVELLVVLAVLALLSGLLVTGLHTAAKGWPRLTRNNAENEERQAVRRMLHHLLSHIYPAKLNKGSAGIVQFDGARDRLDFLAPLAQRFGTDDIALYTLRFLNDGGLRIVWRLDRQAASGEENFIPPAVEESVPECLDGAFSYYGRAEEGGEARWWSRWERRKTLPLLVRVSFVWHGRPEEFVAAPLITAAPCPASVQNAACQE